MPTTGTPQNGPDPFIPETYLSALIKIGAVSAEKSLTSSICAVLGVTDHFHVIPNLGYVRLSGS